ncbi:MAG: glycosyltransferase [Rickettsiales bacterium]|jgi:GT2 family glycosyltransferase|nr:glycosyltransferase [Rickettsiales bacterium]
MSIFFSQRRRGLCVRYYVFGIRVHKRFESNNGDVGIQAKWMAKFQKNVPQNFALPKTANPLVSIIIPAYNQYEFTHACIHSVLKNVKGASYEVILADDCSTDETKNVKQRIKNIVHVRNKKNLRFLKNCNNAAKKAKGKYIALLNNDTIVCQNWLESLVKTLDGNSTIGLVGSECIDIDGKIIKSSGRSGKMLKRVNDKLARQHSDCTDGKDVAYVCGASIMISRKLWRELDGFDETFAPSYFEDTDLAFRVREEKGLRVVLQPKSEIIHFENLSITKYLSERCKKNSIVFKKKWASVL